MEVMTLMSDLHTVFTLFTCIHSCFLIFSLVSFLYLCSEDGSSGLYFPSSLEELKDVAGKLQSFKEQNLYSVLAFFSAAYLYKQSFAIPGSFFLVSYVHTHRTSIQNCLLKTNNCQNCLLNWAVIRLHIWYMICIKTILKC